MANLFESAPTGRAKCRGCARLIAKGEWRFGERVPNLYADTEGAESTHWFHLVCAACRRPEPFLPTLNESSTPIPDRDWLVREAELGLAHRRVPRVDSVSRAPSGRAACRACKAPIAKASWRIGLVFYEDGRFAPSGYIHVACATPYLETGAIMSRLERFSPNLSADELADIAAALLAPST